MGESVGRDDARLILKFYELRREPRMREARDYVVSRFRARSLEEFQRECPPGSNENASFRQVTSYWDMVCAIVRRELVDLELFFETNGELTVVWEKVRHLVPEMRGVFKNPLYLAHFEHVAGKREVFLEERAPEYLASLRARLGV